MNEKLVEFLMYVALVGGIYLPFHYRINAGERPGKRFDFLIGWLMFMATWAFFAVFVLGIYSHLSDFGQYFVIGSLSGVALSVNEMPYKGRVLPRPYRNAKLTIGLGLLWAIGGVLGFYKTF